ncbi:caspase-3 [Trichonephila clavata]|uniref:Caspase-3 n=1 Tax=Trichonephila clavata TaxID=2740835 RepID=A0A8X6FRP1_TRICU|nr:caspase-3 [Trichonephila clavata]
MDPKSRQIIQDYKSALSEKIDLSRIIDLLKEFKLFTKAMLEDIFDVNSTLNFYDELCSRGPHAFSTFIVILKKVGYQEIAEMLEKPHDVKSLKPFYYKMDSTPVGYCLIIINEIFEDETKNRRGSKVDAYALEILFEKQLGYKVTIKWNKKAFEMFSILLQFSKKPGFETVDSCVVYILSHGGRYKNRDYILGTDHEEIYLDDIYEMFNNENCESLIGKPKIFFFQACRGNHDDHGVKVKTVDSKDTTNLLEKLSSPDASDFSNDSSVLNTNSISTFTDIIIVHSTLPNHRSWKDHETGSWLCEDLVNVVSNHYHDFDLGTMLTIVSRRMQRRVSGIDTKQIVHVETLGATGLIHFNRKKNVSLKN